MKSAKLVALGAAGMIMLPSPALAWEGSYRIDADGETTINLDICSPTVSLRADGDNDTDLDYWLYDNFGNEIHTDTDSTDLTFATIRNSSASNGRCLPYRLKVKNFGNVYNQMTLTLTEEGGSGGKGGGNNVQSYRVESESDQNIDLSICSPSVALEVRGDGDTDLDFWVYDANGRQVHEDTDSTDITFATLRNNGKSGCATYQLRIHNYGNVYNMAEVKLIG